MNASNDSIFAPIQVFFSKLLDFLPNLLTAILVLIIGIVVAILLKFITSRVLKVIGLDRLADKLGITQPFRKAGIQDSLSLLVSKFIGGLIIVIFAIASFEALDVPTSERLLSQFLLYLPNVFVAIAILIIGYAIGNFLGRATLIASVNAGLGMSGLLARLARLGTFLIALTMALEQLGVGKETITIAFAIVFGGVVLALSLALGLGGRDIAKKFLDKKFNKNPDEDEIRHI